MISILVPTYNCARWLADSLDSVLAQTERDIEVIVVDDGSTDDTPAVLATFAGRIRVLQGAHGGMAAARNLALAHARGDWVAFHDADDVALPDRLAANRAFLAAHPGYDAVFANGERMDGGGRVVPPDVVRASLGRRLGARELFAGFPVYFQSALVPRRALAAAGPFDARFHAFADLEYGYRLFATCRAAFDDRVVFRYRWHGENSSRDRIRGREDLVHILEHLERTQPEAVRAIGRRRLRARIARHHAALARHAAVRGDGEAVAAHLDRALAFRPLHLRYRWRRLGMGSRRAG